MTTYAIEPGSTLVLSVDGGAWLTVVFEASAFKDAAAATAAEVAAVLDAAGDRDIPAVLPTVRVNGDNAYLETP